ncbi:PP2C family protein-serine/threonine phosphatase [Streptomyces sp. NPDC054796]
MDKLFAVERALRTALPDTLPEVIADALREHYGASGVELRMIDYGLTTLQAVGASGTAPAPGAAPAPVSAWNTPQGRAFGAQEPVLVPEARGGRVTAHLPVTIRGDRMGVLSVTLPEEECGKELLSGLEYICEALGHEVLVAERDTDLYLLARRTARLTLAAEMQWQLLPGRSCVRPEFALGAHLEPAYAIFGDSFDWAVTADHLTLSVVNGMNEGMDASLLTNLGVNALRNARRAGLDLAGQAVLADQAIYAQYQGAAHLSVLLLRFDLATGEVEAIDAGSPRIWRLRDGVEPLSCEAQLPLGMFEDTRYVAERFRVRPGDRLLIGSDGVYDTSSSAGESYGERALGRTLMATRLLPAAQVPRAVLRELGEYRENSPVHDDALVMCLDWHGRDERDGHDGRDGREEDGVAARMRSSPEG